MDAAGVNIDTVPTTMTSNQDPKRTPVKDIEFQVSQVIERLEEAVIGKSTSLDGDNAPHLDDSSCEPQAKTVLQQLEDLLLRDSENDMEFASLPELCEASRLSVLSHAIAAYAGSMERNHIAQISSTVSNDTALWITDVFRCGHTRVCYHDDQLGGLVRIIRVLLHTKFPHYGEQGFDALKNKIPVIYTSVAAPIGIVQYICRQLGLPFACINGIPSNTLFGAQKMDLSALEREIELDKARNKIPLIVLADSGTPISGHVDNIPRLQEICRANGLWLHLRGHSLATLAIPQNVSYISPVADSLTLPLGIWLGVPGLPTATIYNHGALSPGSLGLLENPGRKLISLPIWTTFQCLGQEEIRKRFREVFDSCHQLWQKLSKYPNIRLLSQTPGGEGGLMTVAELASKPVNPNVLFEVTSSTVVFQFVPANVEERVPPYYDKLNSWLGQMLQRDCPLVNITLCEVENGEIVLRYCPLEPQPGVHHPPNFDSFITCLEQQIDILCATVRHKAEFQSLVEASACLRIVDIEGWAGLGGVRYQPASITDEQVPEFAKELNSLNINLVERLRTTDAAFSLGEGNDGLACVRFGMVTGDTDVGELLSLVNSAGLEEEESGKVLDSMAEVVKRGIEAATMELQRESDEQLWQEGILRSVPVVGSLVNWFSPHNKSPGIKGRSLDLTAGIVASTENIYRYHMQSSPNDKHPLEQTSVTHSRSPSNSSEQALP